jgi:NAD(P)-dependent dehydrogenase (short-subunit alcohol dehydrogenase family)
MDWGKFQESKMRFAGKTAVVTGAASGIGKATCLRLASEGATVIAADIDETGGTELAATSNGKIIFKRTDVCSDADIKALMNFAAEKSGGIDIVFNNAGAGGAHETIDEIDADGWDRTMDLLLRSVAMGIRHAVPHMKGRAGASIINTASVAALSAGMSPTAYAVAKGGVLHLSKLAAGDLTKFGIRVNAICPGFIQTNIFSTGMGVPEDKRELVNGMIGEAAKDAQPVARGGRPEDIAGTVAFLASDDAAFITGTHILVDGGLLIGPRHSWDPEAPGMFDAIRSLIDVPA